MLSHSSSLKYDWIRMIATHFNPQTGLNKDEYKIFQAYKRIDSNKDDGNNNTIYLIRIITIMQIGFKASPRY